jgi:7-cyano-7-deazaguanine synthase in queuosine biosynthesis
MKHLRLLGIDINLHSGPIGISLSGGADSALLCYILMQNTSDDLHFFTIASKQKGFRSAFHSSNVIQKCIELTGKTNVQHHVKWVDVQTRTNLIDFLEFPVRSGTVDIMYTATTSFPDKTTLVSFSSLLPSDILSRRDIDVTKSEYSKNGFFYSPFINYNKKKIAEIYQHLGIQDTVFPLSRSCESVTNFANHCGSCWWCEERLWAFNRYV